MNVVATAPIPWSRMPGLPFAGFTSTPFLSAICANSGLEGWKLHLSPRPFKRKRTAGDGNSVRRSVEFLTVPRSERGGCHRVCGARRKDRRDPLRIVRHDAVGAELEQALGFVGRVDHPEIDTQPDAVALRD